MKRLMFLTLVLLAACAPAGPVTVNGVDPYIAAEQAKRDAEEAQGNEVCHWVVDIGEFWFLWIVWKEHKR